MSSRRLAFALNVALVALPFLLVPFPPATDLPQHLAQVRLIGEALHGSPLYRLQLVPYATVYALFGLIWILAPLALVPRLCALALALSWVGSVHALAAARSRSPLAACAASIFAFSHLAYWGFASFEFGFAAFAIWIHFARADTRPRSREAAQLALGATLLLLTHALWFAMGMIWLALRSLALRDVKRVVLRAFSVLPLALIAAAWFPRYSHRAAREFNVAADWTDWLGRLSPAWWIDASLGGVRGALEPLTMLVLFALLVAVLVRHRGDWDRELLGAALLLLASAFLLPNAYMNTVRFAERFVPAAFALLALAIPANAKPTRATSIAVLAGLAVFCGATARTWWRWSRGELAGFEDALAQLPQNARVLGLDEIPQSAFLRGKPFLQLHAYAQVLHGGTLNDSFADYPHFPVVYRDTAHPWTQGLEEEPDALRADDLAFFDFVIAQATLEEHEALAKKFPLDALGEPARWRAYRIRR